MITRPEVINVRERRTASIHLVIPCLDMGRYMDPAIREVLDSLSAQGMLPAGPMFSLHNRRPSDSFDFEIGFPVEGPVVESGRMRNSTLPAAKVARAVYQGPYERLGDAWRALQVWVRENGLPATGRFWESYLNNPDEVKDPEEYRTELNWVIG